MTDVFSSWTVHHPGTAGFVVEHVVRSSSTARFELLVGPFPSFCFVPRLNARFSVISYLDDKLLNTVKPLKFVAQGTGTFHTNYPKMEHNNL